MKIKALRICFSVIILLYGAIIIWFDDAPFDPLPWFLIKMAVVVVFVAGAIYFKIKDAEYSNYPMSVYIFLTAIWIFGIVYFMGYKEFIKYKNDSCAIKYGLAFNPERQMLGVPRIPANWQMKIRYDRDIDWSKAKNNLIGHASKRVGLDSVFKLQCEDDQYRLEPIKSISRELIIRSYYTNNNRLDSIIYYYSEGSSIGYNISRQQADSLFAAERIEKDY